MLKGISPLGKVVAEAIVVAIELFSRPGPICSCIGCLCSIEMPGAPLMDGTFCKKGAESAWTTSGRCDSASGSFGKASCEFTQQTNHLASMFQGLESGGTALSSSNVEGWPPCPPYPPQFANCALGR